MNAQTRIPLLTNGTIDIECGSTTNNGLINHQCTYHFYVTGGRLLVNKAANIKEVEDLKGKAIGVAPGTSNERVIKEYTNRPSQARCAPGVVLVRDHSEGMLALETDRIDAYVHDEVGQFALLAKSRQRDRFEVVGRLLSFDPYGLMIRRDNSAFLAWSQIARWLRFIGRARSMRFSRSGSILSEFP